MARDDGPVWQSHISLGNVLALLGGVFAAAGFAYALQGDIRVTVQRVEALEAHDAAQERQAERDQARIDVALRDIKDTLRRVEDKLDRKADK